MSMPLFGGLGIGKGASPPPGVAPFSLLAGGVSAGTVTSDHRHRSPSEPPRISPKPIQIEHSQSIEKAEAET
jgi:hypothetical protein